MELNSPIEYHCPAPGCTGIFLFTPPDAPTTSTDMPEEFNADMFGICSAGHRILVHYKMRHPLAEKDRPSLPGEREP